MSHLATRREFILTTAAALSGAPILANAAPAARHAWTAWPFYVMDTGLAGSDVPTLADKVKLAKDLGFTGIDYTFDAQRLPGMIELLDKAGLELTAIYTSPLIEDPLDPKLPGAIKLLRGRPTRIEMALRSKNHKSSDPSGDRQALDLISRTSDLCAGTGPVV
jgi:hypothetical protein